MQTFCRVDAEFRSNGVGFLSRCITRASDKICLHHLRGEVVSLRLLRVYRLIRLSDPASSVSVLPSTKELVSHTVC